MSHKPVCVKCQVELKPSQIGVVVVDMVGGKPYQIWNADVYKCPKCGVEIVQAFATAPMMNHEQGFADYFEKVKVHRRVIYCQYK